tara:strand:- start:1009 stop:1539 length:531 start_codon:yes stop_codon:yes gene_type:complete
MKSNSSFAPESIHSAYPIIKETVPKSERGYNTNNKYPNFPPLMSDGRSITATWQHDAVANHKLVQENNIKSNWNYRKFLTDNAANVMEQSFRESSNDVGYNSRYATAPNIQSNFVSNIGSPMLYSSVEHNPTTLGHTTSDLKTSYLTRENLQARKISPVITQDELIKSFSAPKTKI